MGKKNNKKAAQKKLEEEQAVQKMQETNSKKPQKGNPWAAGTLLATAVSVGALGMWYNGRKQEIVVERKEEIVTLYNVKKNKEYKAVSIITKLLQKEPAFRPLFEDGFRSQVGNDPENAQNVQMIIAIKASLLPENESFSNLEQRLNTQLKTFAEFIPQRILQRPAKIVNLTAQHDFTNLPSKINDIAQMYLVNSIARYFRFEFTYQGRMLNFTRDYHNILGGVEIDLSKKDIVKSILISLYLKTELSEREISILNTFYCEFLHLQHAGRFLRVDEKYNMRENNQPSLPFDAAALAEEGLVHASCLLYMIDEHPGFVREELERLDKSSLYSKVRENYEAMREVRIKGEPLSRRLQVGIPLLAFHFGRTNVIERGKKGLMDYACKQYAALKKIIEESAQTQESKKK